MNTDEYLKLAEGAYSFGQIDKETQAKILAAEGELRETYVKVFLDEQELLTKALAQVDAANEKAIGDFVVEAKKGLVVRLHEVEIAQRKDEEGLVEDLLKQI